MVMLGAMLQKPLARIGLALGCVLVILQCAVIFHSPLRYRPGRYNGSYVGTTISEDVETVISLPPPALNWSARDEQAISFPDVITRLYDYIEHPTARCERAVRIGGKVGYKNLFDGQKWACLDARYGLTTSAGCLVYSFGINSDWSFDDNVQMLDCQVYAFDPTIGQPTHNRSERIHFYDLGLSDQSAAQLINGKLVQVRRYADIVAMLGHTRRTVHYLKIDIEGSEWPFFKDVLANSLPLLRNVMQIGMEIHFSKTDTMRKERWYPYLRAFAGLDQAGFKLFHSEVNPYEAPRPLFDFTQRKVSRVYELVWLNQGSSSH